MQNMGYFSAANIQDIITADFELKNSGLKMWKELLDHIKSIYS